MKRHAPEEPEEPEPPLFKDGGRLWAVPDMTHCAWCGIDMAHPGHRGHDEAYCRAAAASLEGVRLPTERLSP